MRSKEHNGRLDKFHLFTALPTELQLIIWDFWRENRPVFYHYLFLAPEGRYYSAVNMTSRKTVHTTAQTANPTIDNGLPLDPFECKITFTNRIKRFSMPLNIPAQCLLRYWNGAGTRDLHFKPRRGSRDTWVSFERDTFIVHSTHRLPGKLRFLFNNIGSEAPKDIQHDAWPQGIRRLAMYVFQGDSLCELDRRAFSQLKSLRSVWLLVHLSDSELGESVSLSFKIGHHLGTIKDMKDIVIEVQGPGDDFDPIYPALLDAQDMRTQLVRLFEEDKRRGIDVRVMLHL
ncbi:hypothetical protein F4802DRAFT_615287 [Xylaria palmicola]|nr:hypothetical protein F4802DRAFT_615287 [Xylaria palmicola]